MGVPHKGLGRSCYLLALVLLDLRHHLNDLRVSGFWGFALCANGSFRVILQLAAFAKPILVDHSVWPLVAVKVCVDILLILDPWFIRDLKANSLAVLCHLRPLLEHLKEQTIISKRSRTAEINR